MSGPTMWICAAADSALVRAGVIDFANIRLFCVGIISPNTAIQNFKYIKLLYIIDIKSGLDCQFHSSKYFHKHMKIFNYFTI
jgi:hypothetical protein